MSNDKKNTLIYSMENEGVENKVSFELPGVDGAEALEKRLKDFVLTHKAKKTPRIATDNNTEEQLTSSYGGIIKQKRSLVPDDVIKSVRVQNHLIASILRARANTISMFGHPRANRLDIGFEIALKDSVKGFIEPEEWGIIQDRIFSAKWMLYHCGREDGIKKSERMTLDEFLYLSVYDGISLGRFAVECIYEYDEQKGEKLFHRFRPVDAATIYRTYKNSEATQGMRESFLTYLKQKGLANIDIEAFKNDEYAYVQIVNNQYRVALTDDEMIVVNLYPTNDIEFGGYPVTPIDTTLNSITSHLSIDVYNRLYFQNGRASKGILVVSSEDLDQQTIDQMRHDFIQNINSVGNAFRVPVFGVTPGSNIQWVPVNSNNGDAEFMFLYDAVARSILTAFAISPDELPGMGHLSRGTNQKTLSESNNEFKLTAARDTGLRPLILKIEAFLDRILELIDPDLAQIAHVKLSGLDAETREQEAVRISQESPIHMDYDEILSQVEKKQVGPAMGGRVPFNERYQLILDKYLNVGDVIAEYMENPVAAIDPILQYKRDPFWIQFLQILMQVNPATVQSMFSTRPYTKELMEFLIQDYLETDGVEEDDDQKEHEE